MIQALVPCHHSGDRSFSHRVLAVDYVVLKSLRQRPQWALYKRLPLSIEYRTT